MIGGGGGRAQIVFFISFFISLMHLKPVGGAGGRGRAWGRDLIVFVGPGVGHLTNLVLQWEGIFESFFARRGTDMGGMDLTADRDERD